MRELHDRINKLHDWLLEWKNTRNRGALIRLINTCRTLIEYAEEELETDSESRRRLFQRDL